ncbi:MAG: PAS domain S-box protein, partial [Anaerolineales bacterium]|nr:PAS domain S-box protein [Anaerolineales bacterium]
MPLMSSTIAALSRRARVGLTLAAGVAYLIVYGLLRPVLGPEATILSVLPVMVAGGLLGFWPGVLAGVLLIPLNSLLLSSPSETLGDLAWRYRLGHLAGVLVGGVVGLLSDVSRRYRTQSAELAREIAERRRAEAALRDMQATLEERVHERTAALQESEARYRQLYESNRVVQLLIDPQTLRIVDGNAAAVDFYGYDRPTLAGMPVAQINTLPVDEIRTRMAAAVAQAHSLHCFHHRLASGQVREVEVDASPVREGGRRLMHVLVRDVTEQNRYTAVLQRYRLLSEHTRDILLFVRAADGQVLEANAAARAAYGYSEAELLGLNIRALRAPGTQDLVTGQLQQASTAGLLFETVHRRQDGSLFPVEVSSRGLDLDGERVLLSIVRDISARRQVEQALRENEYFLTKSQEVGDLGSYYLNAQTGVWISSPKLDTLLGIDDAYAKDVAGWLQLVHPEHQAEMQAYLAEHVLAGHNRFDKEYRIIRRRDGQERWVHGLGELEFDAAGQPVRMIGTIQDITERKRTGQALAESERRFRETLELSPLYAVALDTAGRITFANSRLAQAAGCQPEALRGQDWFARFIPPELNLRSVFTDHVQRDGFPASYENEIVLPSGERRQVLWTNTNLRGAAGEVTGVASLGLDVTEARRLEQVLRENEAQLRLFYELPFIGMAITSPKTKRWVRVNERLAEILGYPREVLIQKTWKEMTHPDDLALDLAEFERVLAGASDGYRLDKRFIRPDGEIVYATIDVRCLRAADGGVDFFIATVQDIGDRKRIEAELERRVAERTAQLEVANRELEAFAYSVSHDLRAPLRAIDGFSQVVLEDYGDRLGEAGQADLRRVRHGAQQMGQLIDALLLLSRVTRQELHRQPVDLSALVRGAIQDLQAGEPGRAVAVSLEPDLTVAGDLHLLRILLTNL